MLTHWGMQPTTVDNGLAALDILERAGDSGTSMPLVLLDAHMPEMDGHTVAEWIKQNHRLKGITILMLSSSDERDIEVRCRQVGVYVYLRKPITRAKLWEAMIAVLSRPEIQKADRTGPTRAHDPQYGPEKAPTLRLRVLLAEDNVVNQRLVVRLLEKHGHTMLVAGTGREVLTILERQPVDIVLMDVQMPEMDGLEATAAIREQERQRGGHLPIIALTAHAMKGDQERCRAAGMDGYVSKPINMQTLSTVISQVLNDIALHNLCASKELTNLTVAMDPS